MASASHHPHSRPAWANEILFPFQSNFAQIEGAVVHYVDEGEGPPLLLLHGNPTGAGPYIQEDAPDEIVAAVRSWRGES